jgi:hypothetical protein
MTKYLLLLSALLIVGVGGVAAQSANVTFDKNTDFSKFKTYKWVTIRNAQQLDQLTEDQLIGTLQVGLSRKGLTKSDSDNADLFIGYQMTRNNQKQSTDYNVGGAYGSAGGSSASAATSTTTVHSGRLVLDMYDPAKKQLLWRGVVSDAIDASAKPEKKQKHLDRAVEKLLKDYPPQKK